MTKAKISEYDAVASNNTDVNGVNIAENCPPSGMNNMGREIMAALKRFQTGSDGDGVTVGGNLVVSGSSTLATTAISSADINGGTIDGTAIGGASAAAGAFTTLFATGVTTVQAGTNSAPAITTTGDTNTGIFFPAADTIAFTEGGAEAMRIDSSGNVGIGVVPGAWSVSGALQLKSGVNVGSSGQDFYLSANHLFDGTSKYISNGAASQYSQEAGVHKWFTASSGSAGGTITFAERMRIDSSGLLLVGATSAFGTGFSTFQYLGATRNGISVVQTDNASASRFMNFAANGSSCGVIDRVGTTSAVVYTATSDYRLKNVTGAVTGQGERIDALKPIDYRWKEDNSQTRGFLAHEFQTVYPNSVTGEKDAVDAEGKPVYQAMQASSSEVIADLVAEIQSLRQRLAAANL